MVTIKIDERTRAGKAILEIVEIFSKDREGVEIISTKPKKLRNRKIFPMK